MYSPLTSHDKRLPVDLSDCFTAGISGWCGGRCPVLKAGECPDQSEMASALDLPPCGYHHGLVAAFLAKHFGGHETPGAPVQQPLSTVTTVDHHAVVASSLIKFKGTCLRLFS